MLLTLDARGLVRTGLPYARSQLTATSMSLAFPLACPLACRLLLLAARSLAARLIAADCRPFASRLLPSHSPLLVCLPPLARSRGTCPSTRLPLTCSLVCRSPARTLDARTLACCRPNARSLPLFFSLLLFFLMVLFCSPLLFCLKRFYTHQYCVSM